MHARHLYVAGSSDELIEQRAIDMQVVCPRRAVIKRRQRRFVESGRSHHLSASNLVSKMRWKGRAKPRDPTSLHGDCASWPIIKKALYRFDGSQRSFLLGQMAQVIEDHQLRARNVVRETLRALGRHHAIFATPKD